MSKKLNNAEFIDKAIKIHKNLYNYSFINYINNRTRLKIYCNTCKSFFYQAPSKHLYGRGCTKCGIIKNHKKLFYNNEIFIKKAKEKYKNKYNYDKINYINSKIKVKVYCNICKKYFLISPSDHLFGKGCQICSKLSRIKKKTKTKETFIKQAIEIHNHLYDYNESNYINGYTEIKILCNLCKKYFNQVPSTHLTGRGCPYCKSSYGELQIRKFLEKNNIEYEIEKKFEKCKYKYSLPFDFYIKKYNICIEFNGLQHYKEVKFFGGKEKLILQKLKDKIKRKFCKENNILLIEIKYNQNIEEKLNFLKNLN